MMLGDRSMTQGARHLWAIEANPSATATLSQVAS